VLFRTGQRGPNISVVVFRAFAKVTYPSDKKDQHLRITFRLQYSSTLLARQTFHVLSPIPAFNAFSGAFWTDLIGSLDREDNFSSWFFLKAQMFFFLNQLFFTYNLHNRSLTFIYHPNPEGLLTRPAWNAVLCSAGIKPFVLFAARRKMKNRS